MVLHRYERCEAIVDRVVCFGRMNHDAARAKSAFQRFFFRGGGDEVVPTLHLVDWLRREGESD